MNMATEYQGLRPPAGFQVTRQWPVADVPVSPRNVQAAIGWNMAEVDPGLRSVPKLVPEFTLKLILFPFTAPAPAAELGGNALKAHDMPFQPIW